MMLHQSHVSFPWFLLRCRSQAVPCSRGIKLSKEFLFNLVIVQYFFPSVPPALTSSPIHTATAHRHAALLLRLGCVGLGLSDHPREQSSSVAPHPWVIWSGGGEGFFSVSPGFSPHEVIFPGTSITAFRPGFVAASVHNDESSPGRQSLY